MAEYRKDRYFWIKLTDGFMTGDAVDFLMQQKDGANYVVLYQLLCLKTANNNGILASNIGEIIIPYDEQKIQRETKYFGIDTIRVALGLYQKLNLIYRQNDGTLSIANFDEIVGSQTVSAAKKQEQIAKRQGGKEGGKEGGQRVENRPPDIEIDIEIDIERDKEIKEEEIVVVLESAERDSGDGVAATTTTKRFTKPSISEIQDYIGTQGYTVNAEHFCDYYEANGWKVGRNPMRDWKAAVRNWQKNESPKTKPSKRDTTDQMQRMYDLYSQGEDT